MFFDVDEMNSFLLPPSYLFWCVVILRKIRYFLIVIVKGNYDIMTSFVTVIPFCYFVIKKKSSLIAVVDFLVMDYSPTLVQ